MRYAMLVYVDERTDRSEEAVEREFAAFMAFQDEMEARGVLGRTRASARDDALDDGEGSGRRTRGRRRSFCRDQRADRRLLRHRVRGSRRGDRDRFPESGRPLRHDRGPTSVAALADAQAAVDEAFRANWGRVVAYLIHVTGDWDLAEECAQDAFERAIARWPRDGIPSSSCSLVENDCAKSCTGPDATRHGGRSQAQGGCCDGTRSAS